MHKLIRETAYYDELEQTIHRANHESEQAYAKADLTIPY